MVKQRFRLACDDLSWFNLDHLPPNMVPYVRRSLADYCAGQWFDSYGWEE